MNVPIIVTEDPQTPGRVCRPAEQIERLMNADLLRLFVKATTEGAALKRGDGLGNCHEATLALMTDLVVAKEAARWKWAEGRVTRRGVEIDHSWLECDGWALDCANGHLLFMRRAEYRQFQQARDVKLRDASATKRWVHREAKALSETDGGAQ